MASLSSLPPPRDLGLGKIKFTLSAAGNPFPGVTCGGDIEQGEVIGDNEVATSAATRTPVHDTPVHTQGSPATGPDPSRHTDQPTTRVQVREYTVPWYDTVRLRHGHNPLKRRPPEPHIQCGSRKRTRFIEPTPCNHDYHHGAPEGDLAATPSGLAGSV